MAPVRHLAVALAGVALLALSGCATITSSEMQPISLTALTPEGERAEKVSCVLRNDKGQWEMKVPGPAEVRRSDEDLIVRCMADGMPEGRARIISRAAPGLYGNILFGGAVGAVIDHSKGTGYNYPDAVRVRMGHIVVYDRGSDLGMISIAKLAPPGAAPPAPRPGDQWTYRYTDGFTGVERIFVYEVVSSEKGRIRDRVHFDGQPDPFDEKLFTADDMRLRRRALGGVTRLEFSPYLHIFQADDLFGAGGTFRTPPEFGAWTLKWRVVGDDVVDVAGVSFDTVRAELLGDRPATEWRVIPGPTRIQHIVWYSPKARRYVKYQLNAWNAVGSQVQKDEFELLDFKLQ